MNTSKLNHPLCNTEKMIKSSNEVVTIKEVMINMGTFEGNACNLLRVVNKKGEKYCIESPLIEL